MDLPEPDLRRWIADTRALLARLEQGLATAHASDETALASGSSLAPSDEEEAFHAMARALLRLHDGTAHSLDAAERRLEDVRQVLRRHGHCGDGNPAVMVERALHQERRAGEGSVRRELQPIIDAACTVLDRIAPDATGTLAERVEEALRKAGVRSARPAGEG